MACPDAAWSVLGCSVEVIEVTVNRDLIVRQVTRMRHSGILLLKFRQ